MPIKGKIIAMPHEQRLQKLKVGEEAYIDAFSLTITRQAIFIDINTFITYKKDFDDEDLLDDYFLIKRIGNGLAEDDFELDLTILDDYEFVLDGSDVYLDLLKEADRHIIFRTFELEEKKKFAPKKKIETIDSLQKQLKEAVNEERYEDVRTIEEKINKLKT